MMRRLRDEAQSDPVAARAARLLEAAPPLAVPAVQRARIWHGVVAREPQRSVARVPWLECASALLLAAVAATAVVGWSVVTRRSQPAVAAGRDAPPITPRLTPLRPTAPEQPALAPTGEPTRPEDERPPVQPTTQPIPRLLEAAPETPEAPPASQPTAPDPTAPGPALRAGGATDSGLVLDAVRALRRERDSYRASQLVYTYLCTHPDGPLAEEALGVAIDAAASRHDERVVPLADRYLARYPDGRYAAAAGRARARFADVAKARGAVTWTIPCGAAR